MQLGSIGHQKQLKNCRCAGAPRVGSVISGIRIHIKSTNDRQWPVWRWRESTRLEVTAGVGSCLAGTVGVWIKISKPWDQILLQNARLSQQQLQEELDVSCSDAGCVQTGLPSIFVLLLRTSINTISIETGGVMNHWYLHVPHYEAFGQNYSDFPIFAKTHLQVKSFSAMFSKLQGLRLSGFIETKQRRNFHNICFKLSAGRFFQLDGFQNFLKTSPNHSQTFFLVMTSIHGDCPLRWSGLKRAADQAKGKLERWNIAAGLKTS